MRNFAADWEQLQRTDPEVAGAIMDELERERTTIRLIASENFASPAVLAAQASTMNNKYAEGYPGRRYYGGCQFVDVTEALAIDRAKELFGADHANVQPHAGAQANIAVYGAFLQPHNPDQKVLGLVLAHGGHLTHGSPVNVSGKWFNFVGYEVEKDTEVIDMDRVRELALAHRPRLILAGFTAYPRVIDFAAFRQIADEVGAVFVVDAAHFIGLVAGDAYPSPVPYADVVSFTTHKTLRGPRGAIILCRAEHAKAIDKAVFPMMQGGPLEHVIAAKAVCLKEAMQPAFKEYSARVVRTARALAAGLEEEGLRLLHEASKATGLPVVTEVMEPDKVDVVAQHADILQIGARNIQNFSLLKRVAECGKPVLLKRGMSTSIQEWLLSAEYVLAGGNPNVILCERGIRTFETSTRFTLDLNAIPVVKKLSHLPVFVDPSHGTGHWEYVASMAKAALAAGADGLIIEVHNNPTEALSDGPQSLKPDRFAKLMAELRPLAQVLGRSL